jgi:protein-S-isoprenylcysteine O-methyltransferase Ste14
MAWSLLALKERYQAGGSAPLASHTLVISGPYRFIRHPMYTSALCISLGLAGITNSCAFFSIFCIYLVMIVLLVPFEETGLRRVYGEQYEAYRQKSKKLIPYLY